MPVSRPAILTYHSQNIAGHDTANNDHVAFQEDLEGLHQAGFRIVSLDTLVNWLELGAPESVQAGAVCITFDDGCDFDARDLEWPGFGIQRSMLGIMQDFIGRHGVLAQRGLHATAFVIASPEARRIIDRNSLFGHDWMQDSWWREARQSGLVTIGNHGWDHNHPDLAPEDATRGGFLGIADRLACEEQVLRSARYIEQTAGAWPEFFAYPFGESSDYLRAHYFPAFTESHRCRAALGTEPGPVRPGADRWNLPRYVCGRDWSTPRTLLERLASE